MLDNQFTQPSTDHASFSNANWNSQLLGQLFSGFLDALDDPLEPLFSTNESNDDASQDETFPTFQFSTSKSLSPFSGLGAGLINSPSAALLVKPSQTRESRDTTSRTQQASRKHIIRTSRSRSIFAPLLHSPKDNASMLVEFYFSGTAQAYSVYDSDMNPFRSTVSRLWNSSRVIYLSLQSMAAACLVEIYPALALVGERLRQEALELLNAQEIKGNFDDKDLLALLMLGGTSGWHDPQDKGVSLFNSFRRHVQRMQMSGQLLESSNSLRFFQESLMYWEMLLAYVVDDDKLERSRAEPVVSQWTTMPATMSLQPQSPRVPHPWTGIARETQCLVLEIGRLVRSQRLRAHRRFFTTQAAVSQLQSEMKRASDLEAALLSLEPLTENEVVSPEDRQTPVWHLLALADVYCQVGLLQLYRVFPDLLKARLAAESASSPSHSREDDTEDADAGDADDCEFSQAACDEWLTAFALQTLDLLRPIPVESGTRDFQPFLLVACCSELRYPSGKLPAQESRNLDSLDNPISLRVVEISRARGLVLSRLRAFLHCLPPKPIRRCIDIVEATWRKMDDQAKEAEGPLVEDTIYWMDVMIERGWETTMG